MGTSVELGANMRVERREREHAHRGADECFPPCWTRFSVGLWSGCQPRSQTDAGLWIRTPLAERWAGASALPWLIYELSCQSFRLTPTPLFSLCPPASLLRLLFVGPWQNRWGRVT